MKVVNHHSRLIEQPIDKIAPLVETLGTSNDAIWPIKLWPAMRFRDGIRIGEIGGHGPIRYSVAQVDPGREVVFRFIEPKGFEGTHALKISKQGDTMTKLEHEIRITTHRLSTIWWLIIIRPLHDALIEDAFDNVAGKFDNPGNSSWSPWVRFLRHLFKMLTKKQRR